jgi:hypothetical protein
VVSVAGRRLPASFVCCAARFFCGALQHDACNLTHLIVHIGVRILFTFPHTSAGYCSDPHPRGAYHCGATTAVTIAPGRVCPDCQPRFSYPTMLWPFRFSFVLNSLACPKALSGKTCTIHLARWLQGAVMLDTGTPSLFFSPGSAVQYRGAWFLVCYGSQHTL